MTIDEFIHLPGFISINKRPPYAEKAGEPFDWFVSAALSGGFVIFGYGDSLQQAINDWSKRKDHYMKLQNYHRRWRSPPVIVPY